MRLTRQSNPTKQRVNEKPRISVNKLGEYMIASVRRRRSIIRNQKRPATIRGLVTYDDALDVLQKYFADGARDEKLLSRGVQNLQRHPFKTEFQNRCRESCRLALVDFQESHKDLIKFGFDDVVFVPGRKNASEYMRINGVSVSLRPDLLVYGSDRDGRSSIGILKFHFAKSTKLTPDAGSYITTLLHKYAEEHLVSEEVTVSRSLCTVFDIRQRQFFRAPKNFIVRREEIDAACEEISARWDSL